MSAWRMTNLYAYICFLMYDFNLDQLTSPLSEHSVVIVVALLVSLCMFV